MKVFITGGSGYVGTHVMPLLIKAGHEVHGLARSPESAAILTRLGATPISGSQSDLELIARSAAAADATIHLAFDHGFIYGTGSMEDAVRSDRGVIDAVGGVYQGTGKILIITSGTLVGAGAPLTEDIPPADLAAKSPQARTANEVAAKSPQARTANEVAAVEWAAKGVKSIIVRLSPTVHGGEEKKASFMRSIVDGAQKAGFAAIIGDGSQSWPAVHVSDAAELYVLALEKAQPGWGAFHAVAEENSMAQYASIIAKHFGLDVKAVPVDELVKTHGFLGYVRGADNPTSNAITKQKLGWEPKGNTIVAELEQGAFFD
jgi:nucleoside-diphosphate-sugar epimerase